jgi:hypothetical protein
VTIVDLRPTRVSVGRACGDRRLHDRGGGGASPRPRGRGGSTGRGGGPNDPLRPRGPRGVPGALDEPARDDRGEVAFDEAAQAFLPTQLPPNVPTAAGAVAGARSLEGAIARVGSPGSRPDRARDRSGRRRRTDRTAPSRGLRPRRTPSSCRRRSAPATASSSPACAWT